MVKRKMIEYRLNGPLSQERMRIRLMSALREGRFPQAILIDGPVGIGKKALAMELSKALQCTHSEMRPCGTCFACKMALDAGVTDNWVVPMESEEAHAKNATEATAKSTAKTLQDYKQEYISEILKNPYSIEVFSAAAEISVGLIRILKNSFALKEERVRVVIVAEADHMNESAANAFLKILEEVPSNTYFIITTSAREKLLQTILSRCLSLHLLPLSDKEVREEALKFLDEDDKDIVTDDVIGLSMGSPGRALYYAENGAKWCALAKDYFLLSSKSKYVELFSLLKEHSFDDALEANQFLEVLSFLISDLIRQKAGAPLRLLNTTPQINMENFPQISIEALENSLEIIQETISRILTRRTSVMVCLQSLAIKLFEGYK